MTVSNLSKREITSCLRDFIVAVKKPMTVNLAFKQVTIRSKTTTITAYLGLVTDRTSFNVWQPFSLALVIDN